MEVVEEGILIDAEEQLLAVEFELLERYLLPLSQVHSTGEQLMAAEHKQQRW